MSQPYKPFQPKPYDPENIGLNTDELTLIENIDKKYYNSIGQEVADLKGNGKQWIRDAVFESFQQVHEESCKKHEAQLGKHEKKLKQHDWWIAALATSTAIIILILIIAQ